VDATGIDLPPTLIYDYPNCGAVATHLTSASAPDDGQALDSGSIDHLSAELKRELARSLESL
jgi:hypothetical protein